MEKIKARNIFGRVSKKVQNDGLILTLYAVARRIGIPCIFLPLCIFMRLIKPIIFIRVGSLSAHRIGPLISIPALYLMEKDHGIQPQNALDIFIDGYGEHRHVCNYQLLKMWKRVFSVKKKVVLSNNIIVRLLWISFHYRAGSFPFAKDHIITTTHSGRDVLGLIEKSDVHLKFTAEEIVQAKLDMKKMGIEKTDSYVCILDRSQKYLESTFPQINWKYHTYRNVSIEDYMLASEELTNRSYYVVRMGSIVDDLMRTDNPRIIEYAYKGYRTELLDIYLCANCHFFVSCGTGLDAVPWFFKRPSVYVNAVPLEDISTWSPRCITIFKKHWLKKEKRFMTVREILESGIGRFALTEKFSSMGIELIENSQEEVLDVCIEMDERLKGNWQTTDEDEELQKRFWDMFPKSELHGEFRARIGAEFLRQNSALLD